MSATLQTKSKVKRVTKRTPASGAREITTATLARVLAISDRTLRRATANALAARRACTDDRALDPRSRALAAVRTTPGKQLRWDPPAAAAVAQAFGRKAPSGWTTGEAS